MKTFIAVAMLLAMTIVPAYASLPHHRPCDWAQDHPEEFLEKYWQKHPDERGGNGMRLGLAGNLVGHDLKRIPIMWCPGEKLTVDETGSQASDWHAVNCGYQAYREKKPFKVNPYVNENQKYGWDTGWKEARKACRSGKLPFMN